MKTLQAVFLFLLFSCCVNKDVTDPKCEALIEQSLKDGCYQTEALVSSNSALCDKIVGIDFKDTCYYRTAIENRDEAPCRKVQKPQDMNYCYALVKADGSYCAKIIVADRRDKCYYDLGAAGSINSCLAVEDPEKRDYCLLTYTYNKEDISACNSVRDDSHREECFLTLVNKHDWNDSRYCDIIPVKEYTDACYIIVVRNTRDKTLCEKIDSQDTRNYCLGLTNTDPSYCERIVSGNLSEDCFFQLSKIIPESIDCTRMNDTDNRDFCYSEQAEYANDSSICSMIVDEIIMNLCYAYKEKDISYCNRIPDIEYAQECREDLARIWNSTEI